MEEKSRCQSCGMPLGDAFYGTNKDNSQSIEYCKICFKDGMFTEPALTVEQMIRRSTEHMAKEIGIPKDRAKELALSTIPQLKRWKK